MACLFQRVLPAIVVVAFALAAGCATKQQTFASPEEAAAALAGATRDFSKSDLKRIFGSDGRPLIDSGDAVADRNAAAAFAEMYDQKHQIVTGENGLVTVVVGEEDWPFPVPLVQVDGESWVFDSPAGLEEVLNRRVGRNELHAMQVCLAIRDAQTEYAIMDPDGDGLPQYAQKFMSDPGKRNGLYWPQEPAAPASPLGELVAEASGEGYSASARSRDGRRPYHGYYYQILTAQGPNAPGGARDYMVQGNMIGGFAVVAWPAEYGNSGIKTFMVNNEGKLYEKDLGDDTYDLASDMTLFDPDVSWKLVDDRWKS